MILCDFQTLWNNHPHLTLKYDLKIGGEVESYMASGAETCTIELSYAMNRSGLSIPDDLPYSSEVYGGQVRSKKDRRGDNYIYSVVDMKAYLNINYPVTENYRASDREGFARQIAGRRGILAIGHKHITIWNGKKYAYEEFFADVWSGIYGASAAMRGIFFWEILSGSEIFDKALYG